MKELTRIREDRGLSQQRLADASSVNKATINQIERGRRSPNVETLEKLAAALEVEIGDFFPKYQAPLPLEDGRGYGADGYSGIAEPDTGSWPYLMLDPWVKYIRALSKTYEPIIGGLPEEPSVEEYRELHRLLGPLIRQANSINEALMESGVAEASNQLWAASKTGEGAPQDLRPKVREFHEAVDRLTSGLVLPALNWATVALDWLQSHPEPELLHKDLEVLREIEQFRKELEDLKRQADIWTDEFRAAERQEVERVRKKETV